MSESESAKGSADCLPKLDYQSSSSIVRLNGKNNNADKISGESTGKLNSVPLGMQNNLCLISSVLFVCFLGPHPQYMEVPRLGVEWELQLPATATATWNLSHVCDLHHSSWQCWIPTY